MKLLFQKANFQVVFFILFLFLGSVSLAQTKDSIVEKAPKKIADPKDHIVVDFSFDSYRNWPDGITQKPYSLGGNAYLMWDYPFGYGPFSVAIGAGFSTHDVHTNGQITYTIDGKYTTFEPLTVHF